MVLEYMNELEGEVSDEKFDDISSKVKEISSTKNAMTDVREGYFAGTMATPAQQLKLLLICLPVSFLI